MHILTDSFRTRWARVASLSLFAFPVALVSPASAQLQDILKSNHYLCYRIIEVGGSQATPKLNLQDQFGKSTTTLSRPTFVCNPVDKNGEGILNAASHLTCYNVQDDTALGQSSNIRNQFGEDSIGIFGVRALCVTSLVMTWRVLERKAAAVLRIRFDLPNEDLAS